MDLLTALGDGETTLHSGMYDEGEYWSELTFTRDGIERTYATAADSLPALRIKEAWLAELLDLDTGGIVTTRYYSA